MLGPIDYIIVKFKKNNFDGSILKALVKAVENGTIRIVDIAFVMKDADGNIQMAEIADQHDDLKKVSKLLGHKGDLPLLTERDLRKVGKMLTNDSSAGLLVIEQLWAIDLKKALLKAKGELLDEGRIHPDKVKDAVKELELVK